MALEAEILGDIGAVERIASEWDRLAVGAAAPYCAPAWMLAWWRHVAPGGGALRVVAVRDGGELAGLAPLWAGAVSARRAPYELLGSRLAAPTAPLAAPGREREVAEAIAGALALAQPRPASLELEGTAEAEWPARLAVAWPRRHAWRLVRLRRPLPTIEVEGVDYEGWLARRSSKFRNEARRRRRRLEEAGGTFGRVDLSGLEAGLDAFERLHGGRWEGRGGSDALVAGLRPMLREVAAAWLEAERLRIFTLEVEGEIAAVRIMVAAGGVVDAWNTGFDPRWSQLSPSVQLMLHAIEHAADRGESEIRLGGGSGEHKERFADRAGTLCRETLVPRGGAYPLTRLRMVPAQARSFGRERLSADAKARLRRLARRR